MNEGRLILFKLLRLSWPPHEKSLFSDTVSIIPPPSSHQSKRKNAHSLENTRTQYFDDKQGEKSFSIELRVIILGAKRPTQITLSVRR